MFKKMIVIVIGILFMLLIAFFFLIQFMSITPQEGEEQAVSEHAEKAADEEKVKTEDELLELQGDPSHFPELIVNADQTERGFQLQFGQEQSPVLSGTVHTSDRIVHAMARSSDPDDEDGTAWTRMDAVVVNPETYEVTVIPMYELKRLQNDRNFLAMIDDRNVMFFRPSIDSGRLFYDLVRLNIENGDIDVIAPRFWDINLNDEREAVDFILSAHYSKDSSALLLSSFLGRLWFFDVGSGKVMSGSKLYPAYGDPGSTPPRELVFPSPDLGRFVYQFKGTNHFQVHDAETGELIHEFGFDNTTSLMEPGIVWNPESTMFLIEYSDRNQAVGKISITGCCYMRKGSVSMTETVRQSENWTLTEAEARKPV